MQNQIPPQNQPNPNITFLIPNEFGFCILVIAISHFMNFYLTFLVSKARKQYNVEYPTLYLESTHSDALAYNSVQRAHQNTLESWSSIQIAILLNGLVYPCYSAVFGLIWVIGRIIYGAQYSKGGPKARMVGAIITHLGDLPLLILLFVTGARFIHNGNMQNTIHWM